MRESDVHHSSSFLEAVLFAFVKGVSFGRSQIDNFGTPIAVLFELDAFAAIIRVGDTGVGTNDAPILVGPVIAFVAQMYECLGIDERLTHTTQPIA